MLQPRKKPISWEDSVQMTYGVWSQSNQCQLAIKLVSGLSRRLEV